MREEELANVYRARLQMVELGDRMYRFRLISGLEGNLSSRVATDRVLTTPAGVCKGFLSPQDLVLVDMDGAPVAGGRPSTELDMHLAVYRRRDDVDAVVHGHPAFATAFAVAGRSLDLCLLPEVVVDLGRVPVTSYATPSTEEVGRAVSELVGQHNAVLLRNHGAIAVGRDLLQAYYRLETLEQLAKVTLLAELAGGAQPLTREQVGRLQEIRSVYGIENESPTCRSAEEEGASGEARDAHASAGARDLQREPGGSAAADADSRLARIIATEIARVLGEG